MGFLEILELPLYWDTAGFFFAEVKKIVDSNFTSLIPIYSDYPHTPLLLIFYAFIWKINGYSLVAFRLASILFSLATLVPLYFLGKKFINKISGWFAPLLLASTPLFLSQTFLIYFEIPGMLFKILSFYFLFSHRFLAFLISGLIAGFIRVENFILIPLVGIFYFILGKVKSGVKFSVLTLITFGTTTIGWLLNHYFKSGWLFYSPERYFNENKSKVFLEAVNYLLFSQGRLYLTVSLALMLIFVIVKRHSFLKKSVKSKGFIIFSTLFFYTIIHLAFFSQLGYFLPRYFLPLLPLYYLFFVAVLFSVIRYQPLRFIFLSFLIFIFIFYSKSGHACNFEDSLRVISHIKGRLEAIKFLENNTAKETILVGKYPEHGELSFPFWGYTNKSFNLVTNPNVLLKNNSGRLFVYFSQCESNINLIENVYQKESQFFLKEFDEGNIKIFYPKF